MFLLDEHLSPQIVGIGQAINSNVPIISLHDWRDGNLVGQTDLRILREAAEEKIILVTFDVNTIPALVQQFAMAEEEHSGVVLLSTKSFAQNDSSGIAKALVQLWLASRVDRWINRIVFLQKTMLGK